MIDRINRFAARHFGGVGTTRGSFIRIHAWALAFLVLVSWVAPGHDPDSHVRALFGPVQRLGYGSTDQRGFAPSAFGKEAFHIAWIHGSEGDVINAGGKFPSALGTFLTPFLPEIDHRRVVVDTYDLLGMRLGDVYMTLLEALAAKPDVVILSLNPVWVLNPSAVHTWSNLDARAAVHLAKRPAQWPIGAALLSPSDFLWGVAGSQLTPFRERTYWSSQVHELFDQFGPLDRSQLQKVSASRPPDRSQQLLGSQPITFWASYRLHLTPRDQFGKFITRGPAQWARWVDVSNQGINQFNAVLLRAIASELRTSGIPSIVYLAQANGAWLKTNEAFADAIGGVERQLSAFSDAFRADNVLFQPQSLSRFVSGLKFADETHITGTGTLGPYIAAKVCRVLAQAGRRADCRPIVEGNTGG